MVKSRRERSSARVAPKSPPKVSSVEVRAFASKGRDLHLTRRRAGQHRDRAVLQPGGHAEACTENPQISSGRALVATSKSLGFVHQQVAHGAATKTPRTRLAQRRHRESTSSGICFASIKLGFIPTFNLQRRQRYLGCILLGFLLRLSPSAAVLLVTEKNGYLEGLVVIRAVLGDDGVAGRELHAGLRNFLQARLEIAGGAGGVSASAGWNSAPRRHGWGEAPSR